MNDCDPQQKRGNLRMTTRFRAVTMTAAAAAAAAAACMCFAGAARADVVIGQDWTQMANSNGYTYYDGFTDYADGAPTTLIQQVNRNGNNWLQYNNTNGQYWGQLTAQMWANPAVA